MRALARLGRTRPFAATLATAFTCIRSFGRRGTSVVTVSVVAPVPSSSSGWIGGVGAIIPRGNQTSA
jgi:hypothetical protein